MAILSTAKENYLNWSRPKCLSNQDEVEDMWAVGFGREVVEVDEWSADLFKCLFQK